MECYLLEGEVPRPHSRSCPNPLILPARTLVGSSWWYICVRVQLCLTLRDPMVCQAPLSMGFPRQDTGVGCHFSLWGILPPWGLNPSPRLAGNSLSLSHGEALEGMCLILFSVAWNLLPKLIMPRCPSYSSTPAAR